MPESRPEPKDQKNQDAWETSTRIGYEERPVYHEPRKPPPKRRGSSLLRALGGLLIVGGIAWGTYVVTSTEGLEGLLHPGWPTRPILMCAAGLMILLLEKLIR